MRIGSTSTHDPAPALTRERSLAGSNRESTRSQRAISSSATGIARSASLARRRVRRRAPGSRCPSRGTSARRGWSSGAPCRGVVGGAGARRELSARRDVGELVARGDSGCLCRGVGRDGEQGQLPVGLADDDDRRRGRGLARGCRPVADRDHERDRDDGPDRDRRGEDACASCVATSRSRARGRRVTASGVGGTAATVCTTCTAGGVAVEREVSTVTSAPPVRVVAASTPASASAWRRGVVISISLVGCPSGSGSGMAPPYASRMRARPVVGKGIAATSVRVRQRRAVQQPSVPGRDYG